MRLDLSEIARSIGKKAVNEINEQCNPEDLGFQCTEPIKGSITFTNTGSLLLINGEVSTSVRLVCGRCVSEFTTPITVKIEEEFRIERSGDSVEILPMDEDDEYISKLIVHNILDVRELVRQNLLVELPIQPLCSPECKGLCPTCGDNLNVRQCPCPPAERESPFQVLAGLLDEEEEKDS